MSTTRERDDLAFENVRLVAACLAYKGFRAQHAEAGDDEAHAWSDDNWHLYIEDAWQWLLAELDGLLADRKREGLPCPVPFTPATPPTSGASGRRRPR